MLAHYLCKMTVGPKSGRIYIDVQKYVHIALLYSLLDYVTGTLAYISEPPLSASESRYPGIYNKPCVN